MTEAVWIALVSGGLALAGVALGGWNARLQQQAKFEQEERTRFHERRFDVYSDYIAATQRVFAGILVDGRQDVADGAAMLQAFERARLVATTKVHARLFAVTTLMATVLPPEGEAVDRQVVEEYARSMRALISEIRAELGVAGPEDQDAAFTELLMALHRRPPR